ncbi:MAG: cellulase family glycosylhydrolase [Bacteroidetes bacterium]|nr:cellulase family glycosylhydrolase [Bacteroidota bacterium]
MIYTIIKRLVLITSICLFSLSTYSAKLKKEKNIETIRRSLGAGINLSWFEHTWATPEQLLNTNLTDKLTKIAKAHYATVRLPIAFDMFMQPQSSNLTTEILQKLQSIYTTCEKLKLNLIITYHYGKLNPDNAYTEFERVSWIWKQVQNQFRNQGYDKLFFEIYNEPTLEPYKWKDIATKIVQYIRYEDQNRIYIVGGTNYNNIDELKELYRLPDDKILYTFHFYEPYIFTHQGADWSADKTFIQKLPYPYNPNKMPKMPDKAKGTVVEDNYKKYYHEATINYLNDKVSETKKWCDNNNMPLICTETGVINTVKQKYRNNYLQDITTVMHNNDIPTMIWDYDQTFSVSKSNGKPIRVIKKWIKKSK